MWQLRSIRWYASVPDISDVTRTGPSQFRQQQSRLSSGHSALPFVWSPDGRAHLLPLAPRTLQHSVQGRCTDVLRLTWFRAIRCIIRSDCSSWTSLSRYLAPTRNVEPPLYGRAANLNGCWSYHLEQPAAPHHLRNIASFAPTEKLASLPSHSQT